MSHAFISIFVPFHSDHKSAVIEQLNLMGNPASRSKQTDIRKKLRDSGIHFTSSTVIPDTGDTQHILIEISADGTAEAVIENYADRLSDDLLEVFSAANKNLKAPELSSFLKRHRVKTGQGLFDTPGLNFSGSPEMSVKRVKEEQDLAREIRNYFDTTVPDSSAFATLKSVRAHIKKNAALKHLLSPEPMPFHNSEKPFNLVGMAWGALTKFYWPLLILAFLGTVIGLFYNWSDGIGAIISTLVISAIVIVISILIVSLFLYSRLRKKEKSEPGDNSLPDLATLNAVTERENDGQQNHMTGVSIMKPGPIRMFMLRLVFWVIGYLARTSFRPGFLADIGTIHFARWVMIPSTNKLIFLSNYGGSWESYLEDFITKANEGLTGVWSNTFGFPKSENLFLKGATDGERFKRWARRQQVPTYFWYSAYPNLKTNRIRTNAALRRGLALANSENAAAQWLAVYASDATPAHVLEKDKVQSLLLAGLGKKPFGQCIAFTLSGDLKKAQSWLCGLSPELSYGSPDSSNIITQLALSASGLAKLGLTDEELLSFPHAFQLGMNHKTRAQRILQDTGEDKPEKWRWGNTKHPVDAVILNYSTSKAQRNSFYSRIKSEIEKKGGKVIGRVVMSETKSERFATEPFGFKDGISQPIIRGARPKRSDDSELHLVEPGEFILGYADNHGQIPNTPFLDHTRDPDQILPTVNLNSQVERFPSFADEDIDHNRDFGKNGSFLVIREIWQDQKQFDSYIKSQADLYSNHPGLPASLDTKTKREDWLAAKLIGRWKDGTSLTRFPYRPGVQWSDGKPSRKTQCQPDNDFVFGKEDPVGLGCPYGAHIRRSNPRDSLNPGSDQQIEITNRHRILRRGRTYVAGMGETIKQSDQGLLFMCLNGDIERQFEFIQQTWNMSPQFHGLENEVDPIMGRGGKMGRLTIPTLKGPIQLKNMADFTSIRGGGYFFMPGRAAIEFLGRNRSDPSS